MSAFEPADAARIRETCMCLSARNFARSLTQRYDDALRPSGLKLTQFALLAHVRASAPVAVGDLAAMMSLDQTTMSRNLEPMQRGGYLTLEKSGRSRLVHLTAAGQKALDAAYPHWKAAQRQAIASVGGESLSLRLRHKLAAATS